MSMSRPLLVSASLFLLTSACGDEGKGEPATDAGASVPEQTIFGGDRPVELLVPSAYDGEAALPLIIVLHGHSVTGAVQLAYTRFADLVDDHAAFVMAPDGLVNEEGNPYWNATAACCDFYGSGVDDAGYLRGLIDEVSSVYNVDPKRVFLWGHSNGGFMAYRMACDHADVIAGIVSLAGAMHLDPADCAPEQPVNILQIHGDQDTTVLFDGGAVCTEAQCGYPSVDATLAQWTTHNGCDANRADSGERLDIDTGIAGDETRVEHQQGCPDGSAVDLWVVEGGGHIPALRGDFNETMWTWFSDHPKP
jgi:polyhydroxybutyrate depolymerase